MDVAYATTELERQCTDERYMKKRLGADVAKTLKRRIAELRYATELEDLRYGTGRWEELRGDRAGTWSARLTANWRLIIRPEQRASITVVIIEIVDYHRR
ncbi:type II toxin-antitoxin system RelE/ParE family toxin [Brevibacterium luteolum]|uniref:type II toxin-antitoxin system RelE/ParE family toxin n=1 Tax=Brevibacterium luteolum TaxID=199591 RepID=UPI0038790D6C